MHLGQDARHRDGVVNVRLAGLALLAMMSLRAKEIRAVDLAYLLGKQIGVEVGTQVANQETRPWGRPLTVISAPAVSG